nr:hypothetical protein [Desulfobacterales bacterium]
MSLKDKLRKIYPAASPSQNAKRRREAVSDLRDRLDKLLGKKYKEGSGSTSSTIRTRTADDRPHIGLEEVKGGRFCETPFGKAFMTEYVFPGGFVHGRLPLEEFKNQDFSYLSVIDSKEDLKGLKPDQTVFLDVETTGLSGGTGCYAFLIGVGYFQGTKFFIRQFFMDDFSQEPAMMFLFTRFLEPFQYLITFNGRSFDVNLLETRLTINRMECQLTSIPHLDMVYPARRMWKERTGSCSLGTLEQRICSFYRTDDISGQEVPELYFQYLRHRDANIIRPVFDHNALDILSTVVLTTRLLQFLGQRKACDNVYASDLYSLGRLFAEHGSLSYSIECLETVLEDDTNSYEIRLKSARLLSLIYKRMNRWEDACALWSMMIHEFDDRDPFPFEQLAKYYEHRTKDLEKAFAIVEKALSQIQPWEVEVKERLLYRRDRILRKMKRLSR